MNGCDRMDIISEILETDKLADEKIKKAHEKQAALEKQKMEEENQLKEKFIGKELAKTTGNKRY